MGMRFGLVAVKADVAQLVEAFSAAWPHAEFKKRADVVGLLALDSWMEANARYVSASKWTPDNPEVDAYGFWQDGEWAILLDFHLLASSDTERLAVLSERLGRVLAFNIETTSATALFWQFDGGRVSRHIRFLDGDMHVEGERLPQEDGLPTDRFYMSELQDLQRAFAITLLSELPDDKPMQGMAFVDRTDYSEATTEVATAPPSGKPWWRIW